MLAYFLVMQETLRLPGRPRRRHHGLPPRA